MTDNKIDFATGEVILQPNYYAESDYGVVGKIAELQSARGNDIPIIYLEIIDKDDSSLFDEINIGITVNQAKELHQKLTFLLKGLNV